MDTKIKSWILAGGEQYFLFHSIALISNGLSLLFSRIHAWFRLIAEALLHF